MACALFDDTMPPLVSSSSESESAQRENADDSEADEDWILAMPTVDLKPKVTQHRERYQRPLFPACVAQPITKTEVKSNPDAQEACRKEWDTMRYKRKFGGIAQFVTGLM